MHKTSVIHSMKRTDDLQFQFSHCCSSRHKQ